MTAPTGREYAEPLLVLRFESQTAAQDFYNDPDFAPVKQIRLDSTSKGNAVLAAQFAPRTN